MRDSLRPPALLPALLFGLCFSCAAHSDRSLGIQEASGVTRRGDELLMVGDEGAGTYFRYPLPKNGNPLIAIETDRLKTVKWGGLPIVVDQEAIDVLADGRVVILSERLRALIDKDGMVAEYPQFVAESGNRGLEGLAVRTLPNGISQVAVVWEGGYPRYEALPKTVRDRVGRVSMLPVLLLHEIARGETGLRMREENLYVREFQVPVPPGAEPRAQRFRCPALVWSRFERDGRQEWGFILLLSSEYSLPPRSGSLEDCGSAVPGRGGERYCYKWLMRFDLEGLPVSDPIDLTAILPPDIANRNWEGMGWFKKEQSLVLVYEEEAVNRGFAYVVDLPDDW